MVVAITTGAAVAWWVGIALFVLVVIPVVAFVAWQLVQVVLEIRRYADDIRVHGAGLADELGAVQELSRTAELTGVLRSGLGRYASSIGVIARGGPR